MPDTPKETGADLFIIDNTDKDWKVVNYLREWASISNQFDIATGYFEIGALLALDGEWQKLDKIRLLMGDEVSKRTRKAFEEGLDSIKKKLDDSIEKEKNENDFLDGVPAIVEAIRSEKIKTKVYKKKKFHAKAYITHSNLKVVGPTALVGSSNFTSPGLHQNVELNVHLQREVDKLQAWYEDHWEEAEEISPEILKVIEKHTREYSPFDVYARSMMAYFHSNEVTVDEWELGESKIYKILSKYQQDGYHQLMNIAAKHSGALLCDGVGLGKTYIGLMLIERLLYERKRIALFVPKAARADVWEAKLARHLPQASDEYSNLRIYNHTDILRAGDFEKKMTSVAENADIIIVDEAHHFRNLSSQRARKFYEMTEGKKLFFLTATPINNSLLDLQHLIEYFSRRDNPAYFSDAPLGIHSLKGHFIKMEKALDALVGKGQSMEVEIDSISAEEVLANDELFQALVVQRSRAFVRRSLEQEDSEHEVSFPDRKDPQVAPYSLKKTYGGLIDSLRKAFDKKDPLVTLPIYTPLNYRIGEGEEEDKFEYGRQMQVVGLIRTLLLKRFESSAISFQASSEDLLLKLLYFVRIHNPKTAKRWEVKHSELLDDIRLHRKERTMIAGSGDDEEELEEDIIPDIFKVKIKKLNDRKYNITEMVLESIMDMNQLSEFLAELKDFDAEKDDKLQTLIRLLKNDPVLCKNKVLIFTEYQSTARYLAKELENEGIGPLMQVDSARNNASEAVHRFAPYYNELSSAELEAEGKKETRVLVTTDVLAEGLNLQDATCIINYDLHWNPVRLMQRIGRVDRRLDPVVEAKIIADHPELEKVRGIVHLWNFLPPDELNEILTLFERVTQKTLRISKTFGIEGKKLLTADDDYEALRNFNEAYEGTPTSVEEMRLAYDKLMQDNPHLAETTRLMPLRLFSGKEHVSPDTKAVFFCYRLPAKNAEGEWDEDVSITRWYVYDTGSAEIVESTPQIFTWIHCYPETPRTNAISRTELKEIRLEMDKHVLNSYMKKVQAPQGQAASLLAWMELV
ncbi:MAG: DEAD/DEAH box helicase family protein [Anaerolineae bacterium]|nr:DEAD/DEAH box helicase family protein [Anaerolineae bacterium]MBT7988526.1 DEAD/DEAH box helicase family protein [Anaerolineae bacterium]